MLGSSVVTGKLIINRKSLFHSDLIVTDCSTPADTALVGGGRYPRPSDMDLANHGVLFLDELSEFKKNVLEVLRQPVEDAQVTISRASLSLTYPSNFLLTAAMNSCPCGYNSSPTHECNCTPQQIQKYMSHISAPLLDRIDIHVEVPTRTRGIKNMNTKSWN